MPARDMVEAILGKALPLETVASYGGDAKAAIADLTEIIRHLSGKIRGLSVSSSAGFSRRAPRR